MSAKKQQHIIRLAVQNFKNVKALDIRLNRFVTKISGANGAGKTSALDAIYHALQPRKTINKELIRKGQKTGEVDLETETHIIRRVMDDKGGTTQIVLKESNTLLKPEEVVGFLSELAGSLGFDPLFFINRLKPDEQFEVLKSLVPETALLDELETKNETDSDTITTRKAEKKRLEAALLHVAYDPKLPTEPVDIDALLSEARAMESFNANIDAQRREREGVTNERGQLVRSLETSNRTITELRAELQRLEKEDAAGRQELETLNTRIAEWKPLPEPQDRRALDERISDASKDNSLIANNNSERKQKESFEAEVRTIDAELETLNKNIRDRKLKIGSTLEKVKWPVPGLGFATEEEGSNGRERKNPKKVVTYKGLPLREASTGEQIRVSTAIGMAGKPDLRFFLIREGSLLDDEGMAVLEEMAHENDCQILIEVVDTSGKVGIFMRDGEVAAVNEETATAAPKKSRAKKGVAAKE